MINTEILSRLIFCLYIYTQYFDYLSVISCTPESQSAMAGDSKSFSCYIQHINAITRIQISELDFDLEDETGINGEYSVNDHVTLVVDASAVPGIVVNIDNVTCSVDGNITISVNNRTEDTVSLILTGMYVTIIRNG